MDNDKVYLAHLECSVCKSTFTRTAPTITEIVERVKEEGCPNESCKNVVGVITLNHSELIDQTIVDALNSEFSRSCYF